MIGLIIDSINPLPVSVVSADNLCRQAKTRKSQSSFRDKDEVFETNNLKAGLRFTC